MDIASVINNMCLSEGHSLDAPVLLSSFSRGIRGNGVFLSIMFSFPSCFWIFLVVFDLKGFSWHLHVTVFLILAFLSQLFTHGFISGISTNLTS